MPAAVIFSWSYRLKPFQAVVAAVQNFLASGHHYAKSWERSSHRTHLLQLGRCTQQQKTLSQRRQFHKKNCLQSLWSKETFLANVIASFGERGQTQKGGANFGQFQFIISNTLHGVGEKRIDRNWPFNNY